MSGEEFNKKIQQTKKALTALKKDIQFRDEQLIRNQPTYTLDAEINGQFTQINDKIQGLQYMYQNFQTKAKELGLLQRDLDKRKQSLTSCIDERKRLKNLYQESLSKKIPNSTASKEAENLQKTVNQTDMNKEQLLKMKANQQKKQDENLDDLLGVIGQIKTGQKQIKQQLIDQDGLLDKLDGNMDDNIEKMSKIRKNMTKLLENSSYCCIILVILIEIACIVCNLVLWHKK